MLLSLSGSVARDRSGLIKLTAMSHKSDLNFPVNKIRKIYSTNTTFTHSRWITSLQFTLFLFQILKPSILRGLEDIIHQRKFGTKNVSQLWLWLVSEWSRDSERCVMCHGLPVWPPVVWTIDNSNKFWVHNLTFWQLAPCHNVYWISRVAEKGLINHLNVTLFESKVSHKPARHC